MVESLVWQPQEKLLPRVYSEEGLFFIHIVNYFRTVKRSERDFFRFLLLIDEDKKKGEERESKDKNILSSDNASRTGYESKGSLSTRTR